MVLDSISPSVKGEFLSLESARVGWEAALKSQSKKHNNATLYKLVHRAANLRQGDRAIMNLVPSLFPCGMRSIIICHLILIPWIQSTLSGFGSFSSLWDLNRDNYSKISLNTNSRWKEAMFD